MNFNIFSIFTLYDNLVGSKSQPPLTNYENEVYRKICELILAIHKSKEYVSRERVQQELFRHYQVSSWNQLGAYASRFSALLDLTDRQKSVTFYLQIFEHTFNLCTLHDLDSLLAKFCGVNKYDDLLLGPLDKNPEVQRIFKYKPAGLEQSIPPITTGQVITKFIEFQKMQRRRHQIPFNEFIDRLVDAYGLQTREELGLFCKSLPYLKQVIQKFIYYVFFDTWCNFVIFDR